MYIGVLFHVWILDCGQRKRRVFGGSFAHFHILDNDFM